MFGINSQFLMWMFGAAFMAAGVAARLGLWKNWYWTTRGAVYGYVPLGLLFVVYSFDSSAKERLGSNFFLYQGAVALLVVLGVWWSLRPPGFVKPTWVHWLEEYPEAVRDAMAHAVKEREEWESHVTSRQAVDAWAKTLGKKRRRPKGKL